MINESVSCVVFWMLGGRGKEHDAGAGSQISYRRIGGVSSADTRIFE